MAEEVKNPTRNLPLAIILALGISTVLYLVVALVAVMAIPTETLSKSEAPMAEIMKLKGSYPPVIIGIVSMLAVVNGALIQIIMASRILYGMGSGGMAPRVFSRVNRITKTPLWATALITLSLLALALWQPLVTLAQAASFVTLTVFALMNLSLWRIKLRRPKPPGIKTYPIWVPVTGFFLCLSFLATQILWGFIGRG